MLSKFYRAYFYVCFVLSFGLFLTSCAMLDKPSSKNPLVGPQNLPRPIVQPTTNPFNSKDFIERVLKFAVEQKELPTISAIEGLLGSKSSTAPEVYSESSRVHYYFVYDNEKNSYAVFNSVPIDKIGLSSLRIYRPSQTDASDVKTNILTYPSIKDLIEKYGFERQQRPSIHMPLNFLYYSFPRGFLQIGFVSRDFLKAEIVTLQIVWRTDISVK